MDLKNFRKRMSGITARAWFAAAALAVAASSPYAQPVLFHDHGHGLSFSSDGKSLLAPSHGGLAAYEDGAWWEASGPIHGFSGFSVAERAIYSSGHSRPGVAAAGSAGLIRSTDGGRTWHPLALEGQADFRLLAAGYRSNAIYVVSARPNSAMPAPGLYVTHDEGKSWRRAAARKLKGEIHGLAAHPRQAGTVAVATGRGLYLSRDAGESFSLLDGRELATAVAFDFDGKRLRYARGLSNEVVEAALDGRGRKALRLPQLKRDYVTCLAQNPKDERVLAFATRRRDVYLTSDGGVSWRLIAEGAEPRESTATEGARDR
jgi:photosystem II stability/assembly factor-like uncharacterized protein